MRTRSRRRPMETPWAWCLSFFVAAGVALLGAACGGSTHRSVMLAAFALVAACVAALGSWAVAPLAAGTCWCFDDGFFVHRHGRLGILPVTDLHPLALLAAAALAGWAAGLLLRRIGDLPTAFPRLRSRPSPSPRHRLDREWADVEPEWSTRYHNHDVN